LATGKKLAKPRTRASGGKAVARSGAARKHAAAPRVAGAVAAAPPAQPATPSPEAMPLAASPALSPVASPSQDPAPDAIIHLGAQLTIREAVPLRAELLERVDAVDPVGLDASGVQKVDTAGLQVLLAFTDQRRKAGSHVAWTGCSEPLRKAACLLAIEAALGLPAAGAAA
jgi:ABC-type transporter Mla MlaB component